MSNVDRISALLHCSILEAMRFCQDVQRLIPGPRLPLAMIVDCLEAKPEIDQTPEAVAQSICVDLGLSCRTPSRHRSPVTDSHDDGTSGPALRNALTSYVQRYYTIGGLAALLGTDKDAACDYYREVCVQCKDHVPSIETVVRHLRKCQPQVPTPEELSEILKASAPCVASKQAVSVPEPKGDSAGEALKPQNLKQKGALRGGFAPDFDEAPIGPRGHDLRDVNQGLKRCEHGVLIAMPCHLCNRGILSFDD